MSSWVIFPDMNHLCLVRHDGGILAYRVDAWVDELQQTQNSTFFLPRKGGNAHLFVVFV